MAAASSLQFLIPAEIVLMRTLVINYFGNLNLLAYLFKIKKELSVDASSMKIRDKEILSI